MGEDRFFVMDIETNTAWAQKIDTFEPAAVWVYIGCLLRSDGVHRFFHSWDEYAALLNELTEPGDIVYVHNLAYELEFLARNGFTFKSIIANARHKPIAATDVDFEVQYRCSYKLFDMSLSKLGELVGLSKLGYEYTTIRRADELTPDDYAYNLRDCEIVAAAIKKEIAIYGSVKNIPYTKTGVVRRRLSEADDGELHARAGRAFPEEPVYNMLEAAFTGGYSYGSPESFGQTIHKIYSADIKSSYPGVMLGMRFPMKFSPIREGDAAEALYRRRLPGLHFVAEFAIDEAKAVDRRLCVMPFYKCKLGATSAYDIYNGKVNYCSDFTITVDSVTWEIYNRVYELSGVYCLRIAAVTSFRRLPAPLLRTLAALAVEKERLKQFESRSIDDKDNFRRVKEQLNGMYGANVQKFRTYEYTIDDVGTWASALEEYKRPRNLMRVYAWGVWITAYARRHLIFDGILKLRNGVDDFVYCDTDSVKSLTPLDCGGFFDDETRSYLQHLLGRDYNAIKHFGEFQHELDDEGGFYSDFKHYGAKKYFYTTPAHGFAYTVAGMPKPHKITEPGATMPVQLEDCRPGACWRRVKLAKKLLDNKTAPGEGLFEKLPDGSFRRYDGPVFGDGGVGLYPVDYTLSVSPVDATYCRDYGYNGEYHIEPLTVSEEERDRVQYIIQREFGDGK